MNHDIEKCALDDVTNRQLFALELSSPFEMIVPELGSKHFCSLIAWDATQSSVADISALIDPLIEAGCVYFCSWGPDCARVHDIIDESTADVGGSIMTTWHADQSLEEAIWFFLNVTWPDKPFEESFRASLGIAVGSHEWASEIRTALMDPRSFSKVV